MIPSAPAADTARSQEAARDSGLLRKMGVIGMAAAIVNEVVGAGIFRLPARMAEAAGAQAPLAYLACLLAMGAVVICFAEAGSRVPTSGGPYGYVEAAFGPLWGFVAGIMLWLASVLSCGGLARAFAETVAAALPALSSTPALAATIVIVLAGIAWINLRGVETAARVISVATFVKLLPLILFVIVGAIALATRAGGGAEGALPPAGGGFGRAVILAMFALSGMETPLAASGEVANPSRTIPRAILLAMGTVGLLYVAIQLVADGLLGSALQHSTTPLADAIGTVGPSWRALLLAGAGFSMLCWLASDILGAPRALFAFARDGMLPAALGRLHPRFHTPHVAIAVHTGLAMILAITGTFEQLAVLSTLSTAALYLLGCAAAWVLARRGVAIAGKPLGFRLLPLASIVGVIAMAVLIGLGEWIEIAALIGVAAASALWFAVRRPRTRPGIQV